MSWFENKKILVPVDFSDLSYQAVASAVEMNGGCKNLTVLYVVERTPATDIAARYVDDIDEQHAKHAIDSIRKQFPDEKYQGLIVDTIMGDPAHTIAEFAESNKFDLIVLPSHGRTGIKRLMIGSVAERVVRLAHCPVLVLRS